MKHTLVFLTALVVLLACNQQQEQQTAHIFNRLDLNGWHADVPDADSNPTIDKSFIVKDSLLISMGEPRGHLITDSVYNNYRLDVEYRFTGEPGNCGILVHASTPRALYQMFPRSMEVQMQSGDAGDFWCIVEDIAVPDMVSRRGPEETWGITEGKNRRIFNLTDNSENPLGEWNEMKIECVADTIKVWVNGSLVNYGYNCTASQGQIAVQAEGAKVEFRKIDLTPIERSTPIN